MLDKQHEVGYDTLALGSLVWTTLLEPEAGGSGVPEVKTVLSGVVRPALLSGRAIGAKLGGVTLAIGAGLSVGKEGPFVHVAAATADVLGSLRELSTVSCPREVLESTKIGVAVGLLRKHADTEVAALAEEVVAKWKAELKPSKKAKK